MCCVQLRLTLHGVKRMRIFLQAALVMGASSSGISAPHRTRSAHYQLTAKKYLDWIGIPMTPICSCHVHGTTPSSCGVSQTVHVCAPSSATPTASTLSSGEPCSPHCHISSSFRACFCSIIVADSQQPLHLEFLSVETKSVQGLMTSDSDAVGLPVHMADL